MTILTVNQKVMTRYQKDTNRGCQLANCHKVYSYLTIDATIHIRTNNKRLHMIKLGTTVQHKLHEDLNGNVVQLNRRSNTATVKFWNYQDELMLVSVYLSDLEVA